LDAYSGHNIVRAKLPDTSDIYDAPPAIAGLLSAPLSNGRFGRRWRATAG
jgi:hypothetical protein